MVKARYKETEIGLIPEDWEIGSIENFGIILNGGTPHTSIKEYWNGDIPWCTPTDITKTSGIYINKTARSITNQGLSHSGAILLPKHSLLLCSRATIGDLKINSIPIATNQGFKNVVMKDCKNETFLFYLLQTKKKYMIEKAIGSTFLELSKKALCEIQLQIPSTAEQEKIAEVLSNIDALISSLEKLIEKKKQIKIGMLNYHFLTTDKTPFGNLCSLVTKQTGFDYSAIIKPSLKVTTSTESLPYLQTKNFSEHSFNFNTDYYIPKNIATKFPNLILDSKCLLISIVGSLGNIGLFQGRKKMFLGGAICIAKFKEDIDADFIFYFLQSSLGRFQIDNITKGAVQPTLTISDIRKILVPSYTKKEKFMIVKGLMSIDNDIESLQQKLNKYRQVKQGMMQELLTGRIRLVTPDNKKAIGTQTIQSKGHNQKFDDAVVIGAIVDAFYSDKYALGRKKVQKLLYLFRRKQDANVDAFKKKAAGPYADEIRYKGGEPIAIRNQYIKAIKTPKGTKFEKGEDIDGALHYIDKWQIQSDLDWLVTQFKYTKTDKLELLATIDMAMQDLKNESIVISVDMVKELIGNNKEWKAKLSKSYFSDEDIAWAIEECRKIFKTEE